MPCVIWDHSGCVLPLDKKTNKQTNCDWIWWFRFWLTRQNNKEVLLEPIQIRFFLLSNASLGLGGRKFPVIIGGMWCSVGESTINRQNKKPTVSIVSKIINGSGGDEPALAPSRVTPDTRWFSAAPAPSVLTASGLFWQWSQDLMFDLLKVVHTKTIQT